LTTGHGNSIGSAICAQLTAESLCTVLH